MSISFSRRTIPDCGSRVVAVGLGLCLALGAPGGAAHAGVVALDDEAAVATALFAFMDRYPDSPESYIRDGYASQTYMDSVDDAQNVPELWNVAMGVPHDDPTTSFDDTAMLVVAAQTGGFPAGPTVAGDYAVLALDATGDNVDDFVSFTPDEPLDLDSVYVSAVWRDQGAGGLVDTGYSAAWMRREGGYMALLDWQAIGLRSVRVAFMLSDGSGLTDHYDWAPDDYTGELRTLPVPPSEPVGVSAEVIAANTVTVRWQAPLDPGPIALEYYTATADPGGATCTDPHSAMRCSLTGLEAGQTYTFTVVAYNFFGQSSPPSAPSAPVIIPVVPSPRVNMAPSPPVDVTAVPLNGRVAVHWSVPVQPGTLRILEYIATAAPGGTTCNAGPSTACVVWGLVNGQDYTFTVVARNAAGTSPPSAPSLPVTPMAPVVTVRVKAVSGVSKLKVDVDPNRGTVARGTPDERQIQYWTFKVQVKRRDGSWKTLKKTYRTLGSKETRTVNLKKGTYRVVVNPKYGYVGSTSAEVRLKR